MYPMEGVLHLLEDFNWRDYLRPIRDGLDHVRHRFPGSGPIEETPEEKKARFARKHKDTLRGFAYCESFDELLEWTSDKVDSLQRSTIPLLRRAQSQDDATANKARLMVCHDFAGGYHAFESSSRNMVTERPYTPDYLQFVDTFIYFSHRLVSIPPPTWTNSLHRNGVLSLGTFIIERQTPALDILLKYELIAPDTKEMKFPVAEKLAQITEEYGFDGWLINIEQRFPSADWHLGLMCDFLSQLRNLLGPERKLIWYDALTRDGNVRPQNTLTELNCCFLDVCGEILINHNWKSSHVKCGIQLAADKGKHTKSLYFGIDVRAQTEPKDRWHPRDTFGGGGTKTGVAVADSGFNGVSACIFGPAWTCEHFKTENSREHISRSMWEGTPVPRNIQCRCFEEAHCD